jgi:Ras-related protein Rap-1B
MKSGQGFLLVFSLIDAPSLRELGEIRDQLIRITDDPKVPLVLVGNKSDLSHMITVDNNRIKQASQGWGGIPYYETSARRRVNVDDAFRDLVRQIMIKERQAEKAMAAQGGTGGNGGYDGNAGQPQQNDGYRQYEDETPREQPKRWRRRRPKCVIL